MSHVFVKKFKYQKLDVFMVFKELWKIFIQKHILYSLKLISKMNKINTNYLMP